MMTVHVPFMGSNMQRQAVPLLMTEAPVIGTGIENKTACDSGVCVVAEEDGVVLSSESNRILVKETSGKVHEYKLTKFSRSNQSNCYNQRPIVLRVMRLRQEMLSQMVLQHLMVRLPLVRTSYRFL